MISHYCETFRSEDSRGGSGYIQGMTKFEFCIPTVSKSVPTGPDWFHEVKYDGYRQSTGWDFFINPFEIGANTLSHLYRPSDLGQIRFLGTRAGRTI